MTRTRRLALGITLVFACSAGAATNARAQSAKASAEALFEDGRRLMSDGKVEAACPKFAASNRLDPSSGTLLNLANCYEKLGRTASAWATYREAASVAHSAERSDHERIAEKRASALEPMLARVTVNVDQPADQMEVRLDGTLVPQAEWGLAVPIDPGAHTFVAKAPGHETWTGSLNVSVSVDAAVENPTPPQLTVTIPALKALPPPPPPAPVVAREQPTPPATWWTTRHSVGVVAGGVALVGIGLGAVFGIMANSTYKTSLDSCPRDKNLCTQEGVSQRDDARAQGNVATAGFIVGGVALAAAVILISPVGDTSATTGRKRAALELSPGLGGMTARGTW